MKRQLISTQKIRNNRSEHIGQLCVPAACQMGEIYRVELALCCIKKMRIVSAGDSLHIWRQRNGFLHAAIAHDPVVESLAQRRRTDD